METKLYYTPPSNGVFDEVKSACIDIWSGYDDTHGYSTEKISRIKNIPNISDNFMFMVAMFDGDNQRKLSTILSEESKKEIRERLIDGGMEPMFIYF